MPFCFKKLVGFIVIALAGGIILVMLFPQWVITFILAIVMILIGLCLLRF
jgi:uncharacterized protein (DUF983 family)